ncbi:anti-sigma factor [Roseicitreum antarcticum]|uniref:Anti-sigma-K factor RskA n=1 Tax=Roseicitreum antarcticum TaxID=564137 RepID=A0A1H3CDK4_9RHOB|nr:anti-sigma factor [Roseicitreum antarcticum]SDX52227.1 Anti-sigma-K factor RskA [Roseicitreum antarcticum]
MTDRIDLPHNEDDEMLAAEYVLGVLDLPDRLAVEKRLRNEPQLAARVTGWQARLGPLDEEYEPVKAPDLMPQIESRLFPKASRENPVALPRRWAFWRGAALGLVIVVLAVAIVSISQPRDPGSPFVTQQATLAAELQAETGELALSAAWGGGTLSLTRVSGSDAGPGQDYEVWAIAPDSAPVSLGLLRGTQVRLSAEVAEGWTLAVSLEPEGGSTTGAPTGPVLAAAALSPV